MSAKNSGFIKLNRSPQLLNLLQTDHQAFIMLTWIAMRACRKTGEALIGDWRRMGATSEPTYRRTKKRLEATGLATFKATSKGTVATLVDTSVFNINRLKADDQSDEQADEQTPQKATSQPATNKNLKESFIKELKEYGLCEKDINAWLRIRTQRRNTEQALKTQAKNFETLVSEGFSPQKIIGALIENNWIGIKPTEEYFLKAIGGIQNVRERVTDTSWARRTSISDQPHVRDVQPGVPNLDAPEDTRGNSDSEKVVAVSP